ncbi:NUDIX domain-containing protein [Clostridium nigeriense]|uniref:NUDIX domain-containing protein n=1 Tax=Clostridium nigeriense TaxID=1805470 RepID=UPI003D3352E2
MSKVAECSIIIKDDFNNIFIVRKKTKKNQPQLWYIVGRKIRGREIEEKCISRAVKDDLKSIVFNLARVGEYILDENLNEVCAVYEGVLNEKVVYGSDIAEGRWISTNELDDFDFADDEKEKILMYIK